MTREEMAVKYGYYRWDDKGGYYVCSHNFLYDLDQLIKEETKALENRCQAMRRTIVNLLSKEEKIMWHNIERDE